MIDKVVDFLNEALEQDPESINKVFLDIAIQADQEPIDHPTIQVTMDGKLRLIGILNGLVSDRHSVLVMTMDEENNYILGFSIGTIGQNGKVSVVKN